MINNDHGNKSTKGTKMTLVVLTKNGTTGTIDSLTDRVIGEVWTVEAKDENGNVVEVVDTIVEVLEYGEDWQH